MTQLPNLAPLMTDRRVIICVGCGGVGKTTTCAATGLAAAAMGKRVLCLTIDPARRLAQSLGLDELRTEAQRIDPDTFRAAGLAVEGSLTVMMLDTKRTFDALVATLVGDPARREWILASPMYQYIATSLAGTQEYMAMEKLCAVKDDPAFDLVVLDTPPTSHALDFLDAPDRLAGALDSPAVRWLRRAFRKSRGFSLDFLARSAATVLRGIGRIIGGGMLEQIAEFATEARELFGGWRERADAVAAALRGREVAYVLVTTPDRMAIREVLFFADRLREQGMAPDAFVVNRIHPAVPAGADEAELAAELARLGLDPGAPGPAGAAEPPSDGHGRPLGARALTALDEQRRLGEIDRLHLVALDEVRGAEGAARPPAIVEVPEFAEDIHNIARLAWVARVLVPDAPGL